MEPWIGNVEYIRDGASYFDRGHTIRAAHVEAPRGVSIPELEGDFRGGLGVRRRNFLVVKKGNLLARLEFLEDPRHGVRLRRQPVPPEHGREPKDDGGGVRLTNHAFPEEFRRPIRVQRMR